MNNKRINPDNLAIIDAFWVSAVYVATYLAVSFIWFEFYLLPLLISAPIVFIVNYFIIEYSFKAYIYNRIKVIYKAIGKTSGNDNTANDKENPLEEVQEVVLKWNEEKNREIEELKRMADYRREFLGNVSHELKTPIFNIQGYVSTLLDGGLEDENINRRFLKKTNKSIKRMINIVNDLEKITKLEAGELKIKKETFDIGQLINDVAEFMEIKAQKAGASFKLPEYNDREHLVNADKEAIREVVINLFDNAIKYGDKTGNTININIYNMDNKILIEITDHGIGIPQEALPRVFERFFRTDKARSRKTGGSGLGLAIVKHIIEAHRETITVRSNVGEGTTFSFTLQKA